MAWWCALNHPQQYLHLCSPRLRQRVMRTQLNNLSKRHSTKAERKFSELLKKNHIPFRCKVMIEGREIDFLIGDYAIEIDGHTQDVYKNRMLMAKGYSPIHLNNWEVNDHLLEWLKKLWQGVGKDRIHH